MKANIYMEGQIRRVKREELLRMSKTKAKLSSDRVLKPILNPHTEGLEISHVT